MKIVNYTLRSMVFVAFAFFCSSLTCDLLGDATDININVQLTHTFTVDENFDSQGAPVPYSKVEVINADDNADFKEIKSRIKDIEITKITYKVSDYEAEGQVALINGKATFSTSEVGSVLGTADLALQDIQSAAASADPLTLNFDASGLSQISDNLQNASKVYIKTSGTLSHTPVAFKVKVILDCKVKASPVK